QPGWTNNNPGGTHFQPALSVGPTFASSTTLDTTTTAATFTSLQSNATYYVKVKARNGDGIDTVYDVTLSTLTPAAKPVGGSFALVTDSSITIAWGPSTNAAGTSYQAELSTISAGGPSTATIVTTSL